MSDTNDAVIVDNGNAQPVKANKRSGRPIKPDSKERQCITLYNKLKAEGKDRKQIIAAFVNEIKATEKSALVYYHKAKHAGDAPTDTNVSA